MSLLGQKKFISDLNGEEIVETCYEKEFQMTNHEEFRTEE